MGHRKSDQRGVEGAKPPEKKLAWLNQATQFKIQ